MRTRYAETALAVRKRAVTPHQVKPYLGSSAKASRRATILPKLRVGE